MKKRYVVYLCLILLIVQNIIPTLTPVLPVIQLPGEIVANRGMPVFGGITNTFIATILTFIIILAIALALRPGSRTVDEVPTGIYNFFEMLIEMAYDYVRNAVGGQWARTFFPFFMTFILWIVIANWMELIPGVDSIGRWETMGELRLHQKEAELAPLEAAHEITHEEVLELAHQAEVEALAANEGDMRRGFLLVSSAGADPAAPLGEEIHHAPTGNHPDAADWTIVPYVRAAATDLNFTIALAIISVIMTQYYGMQAKGMRYWNKFFTWNGEKIKENPLAIMDTGVGILEFISEVFKIVSFAFRLLGNIFAGQVLLFVIGSLVPVANLLFWHLEFGIGLLQGVVFALLTLTFMQGAVEEGHH